MAKYGKQQRQESRREATRQAAEAHAETYWTPPPLDECEIEEQKIQPDATTQVVIKRVLWNKQLVQFAVVLSLLEDGNWRELICVDTYNHNCVHRHQGSHDSGNWEPIAWITDQKVVQQSISAATDEVWDAYDTIELED